MRVAYYLTHRRSRCLSSLVITIVAVVVTAGCSSGKSGGPGAPAQPPATAWEKVLGQIRPDGSVSTATALDAFALAIGPVPGTTPPVGPQQVIPSGTLAVLWVLSHWGSLTATQRAAVLTDLDHPRAATTTQPTPTSSLTTSDIRTVSLSASLARSPTPSSAPNPNLACQSADSAGAAKYRAWLPGVEDAISAGLGRQLSISANVFISVNTQVNRRGVFMYTVPCDITGNKVGGCTIHVEPAASNPAYTAADLRSTLVHEMMHCYLLDKFGMDYDSIPPWYVEGVPSWVQLQVAPYIHYFKTIQHPWLTYLNTPDLALARRSYDAVGFFAHLAETGTDPWKVIDPIGAAMVGNNSTAAGWKAAGVTTDFLDSWGSGYIESRHPGKAWTTGGPGLPAYVPPLKNARFGDGRSLPVTSAAFATAAEAVDVDAQVVLINSAAGTTGRITVSGTGDSLLGGGPFCTLDRCDCPQGSPGAGTTFTHMDSGQEYLGITGGDQNGSATLTGMSLANFCSKQGKSCLIGQWTGTGFDVRTPNLTETGGAGVRLHIGPQGNTTVAFDGMQPIDFTSSTGSETFAGTLDFSGTLSGVIKLPPPGQSSGQWMYASAPTTGSLQGTVHFTSPVTLDLGPLDLSSLLGESGGSQAVPAQPVIYGNWTCSANTLVSTAPSSTVSGRWTLTRTGPG